MKRPKTNNEIRAEEVRVIDADGKNLGVLKTIQAIEMAKEKGLDLIEISPNASPAIAKIMDFGKFLYKEKRKERESLKHVVETEMKNIRIRLGTSEHDLVMKAKKASEFLKEGHRLKVELFLRGREKYLDHNFLKTRLNRILNLIPESYKILQDVKKGPAGIFAIIEKNQ